VEAQQQRAAGSSDARTVLAPGPGDAVLVRSLALLLATVLDNCIQKLCIYLASIKYSKAAMLGEMTSPSSVLTSAVTTSLLSGIPMKKAW
jgi:hypothetical protein